MYSSRLSFNGIQRNHLYLHLCHGYPRNLLNYFNDFRGQQLHPSNNDHIDHESWPGNCHNLRQCDTINSNRWSTNHLYRTRFRIRASSSTNRNTHVEYQRSSDNMYRLQRPSQWRTFLSIYMSDFNSNCWHLYGHSYLCWRFKLRAYCDDDPNQCCSW